MKPENRSRKRALKLLPVFLTATAIVIMAVLGGCGGGAESEDTASSTKLPPGATDVTLTGNTSGEETTQTQSTTQEEEEETTDTTSSTTSTDDTTSSVEEKTAYLSGANFTVVTASREDSNEVALTSGARELAGDFLQIEMSVANVGDDLVDLANYSFRLWNPAIDAEQYEEYYGSDGNYGGYVSENIISAALLDYSTLQQVSYSLRIGESTDSVFLFFDLNPLSSAKNDGVTMAGTNLIIYDTDSGDKVEINLAGYAD